jgi:polyisoprenoid-binding protein YceI
MSEPAASQAPRYVIDAQGSRFTISAYATGLLSAVGHDPVIAARDIQGEAQFAPDSPGATTLRVRIAAKSMAVQNDVSEKDRREIQQAMYDQVLEVTKYPEMVYEGAGARVDQNGGRLRVEIDGKLTLHGTTRSQRVSAQLFPVGDTIRAQGEFTIRQADFGIKPYSAVGGTLKIKDEIKCAFDLLARKAS